MQEDADDGGTPSMTIDERRFLELAVHVKLASESMITAARHLTAMRPSGTEGPEAGAWRLTMDELIAMNVELGFMERILRKMARAAASRSSGDVRCAPSRRDRRRPLAPLQGT
jgi:hypothetical protein